MSFTKTLSRDEMKNVKAGRAQQSCLCMTDKCTVFIDQGSDSWNMNMYCVGDEKDHTYRGNGQYGGTACNGQCP